jgi:adenosylcobinamide kinase/adenosylcobinamide-phosphate guanylyltransferase
MAKKCILVTGGARSGKSVFTQKLAKSISDEVLFVATAEPVDTDMKERIQKHQQDRPQVWQTLEARSNIAHKIEKYIANVHVVVVDCLTMLVSNVLPGTERGSSENNIDTQQAQIRVAAEIQSLVELMDESNAVFIIVSNEVGLGMMPEDRFARAYRDLLGKANQLVAEHADEVYFMISGIPIKVKPE